MFGKPPAVFKYPYVCNATTSKNDSTVSSNLSNEAGPSGASASGPHQQHQSQHHKHLAKARARPDPLPNLPVRYSSQLEISQCF